MPSKAAGSEGSFDFGPLPPESYVLAVNPDFPGTGIGSYYRKALFPGRPRRDETTVLTVKAGETVDNLNFGLPPDVPPSISVDVTVMGVDGGYPQPRATSQATDDIWEHSVSPITAAADAAGKASLVLRSGGAYRISAYMDLENHSVACSDMVAIEAKSPLTPVVLTLRDQRPIASRSVSATSKIAVTALQ